MNPTANLKPLMRLWPYCMDCETPPGSVLLPLGATSEQVESALSAIGIYAPRGLDELVWEKIRGFSGATIVATIYDAGENVLVHLLDRSPVATTPAPAAARVPHLRLVVNNR